MAAVVEVREAVDLQFSVWDKWLMNLHFLVPIFGQMVSVVILAVYTFFPIAIIGNNLFWKHSRLDNIKVSEAHGLQ